MMNVLVTFWTGAWRFGLSLLFIVLTVYGSIVLHEMYPVTFWIIVFTILFCFVSYLIGTAIQRDREFKKKFDEIDRMWKSDMEHIEKLRKQEGMPK